MAVSFVKLLQLDFNFKTWPYLPGSIFMPRIAAALLLAFLNKDDDHVLHWMVIRPLQTLDIWDVSMGVGLCLWLGYRRVIGLSPANKCIVLADLTEGTRNESEMNDLAKFVPRGTSYDLPMCIEMLPDSWIKYTWSSTFHLSSHCFKSVITAKMKIMIYIYTHDIIYPNTQCMIYLPTFTINMFGI